MSLDITQEQKRLWARPQLQDAGPIRNAGGFFRTAQGEAGSLGGLPLSSAEDAVAAAVRMAYKVADTQVQRSARLAERLRTAGDRAVGEGSERKAFDASEQLVFRTLMNGVEWLEAAAAEPGSPLKRWLSAQYSLVGAMLGLEPKEMKGPAPFPFGERPEAGGASEGGDPTQAPPRRSSSPHRIRIVHSGKVRRAVTLRRCDVAGGALAETSIQFHNSQAQGVSRLEGKLSMSDDGGGRLSIVTTGGAASGVWKAAVCREDGEQIGIVEVEL